MSYRKSKLDLLVRVRYQNPLPAPPFPPKLLHIPTHPSRYARPDFTAALESETALPMVVDAECGMPLDLSIWDSLWEENLDDTELNPDPLNDLELDPKDIFLLGDPATPHTPHTNGTPSSTSPFVSRHVSWLRKTEYLSRDNIQNRTASSQNLRQMDKPIDVSRNAQIRDIEASFLPISEEFDLSVLRHPNNPKLSAVESYEILPDIDTWPNAYDLFRFSERPGERQTEAYDPRLDCAILRPMQSDGEHFLAYYLAKEDDIAEDYKLNRSAPELSNEETTFHFVRDYETVKIEQDVPNEFLLVIDDGDSLSEDDIKPYVNGESSSSHKRKRPKGAYYKGLERKITLKKRRVNQWENLSYSDKWDAIDLTLAPFDGEDQKYREEALAEVNDPMYMRIDADADGVADEDIVVPESLEDHLTQSLTDVKDERTI